MSFEISRTRANLLSAFAGECQTLAMLEFATKVAKKDGFIEVSNALTLMAAHERSHAKNFFKLAGSAEGSTSLEMSLLNEKSTAAFLVAAADLTRHRGQELYPGYSQIARDEGFDEAAVLFRAIGIAEVHHLRMLSERIALIDSGTMFSRPEPVLWVCSKCGFTHEGKDALQKCPGCGHPRDYFEVYRTP